MTMTNNCIIWESSTHYSILHLGNTSVIVIKDKLIFDQTKFSEFAIIFILAELKWEGKKRTDFFGLELVKQLRTIHKVTCPIVVCSFMKEFKKHEFFKAPGHYLLRLPDLPLPLDQYQGIDEELLHDINIHLFDPEGAFHTLMHDLENKLENLARTTPDKDSLIATLNETLDSKFSEAENVIEPEKRAEYHSIKERIKSELSEEIGANVGYAENNRIRKLIGEKYKPLLYDLLPVKLNDNQQQDFPPKRWQVLFVDDVESTCHEVKAKFAQRGINCLTACSGEETISILKEDTAKRNRIAMVISDFRLYENGDETGKWQAMQGYQLLKHLHANDEFPHYAYAVLTSKKGTILDKIKQKSKFPVLWFYKSDVLSNDTAFNLFYQRICEVASDSFMKKQNLPTAAIWGKGLKGRIEPGFNHYYKLHLESMDYEDSVIEINQQALDNIQFVKENGNEGSLKDTISYQISLRMNEKTDISENLQKFRESILLCRRIYFGLNFFLRLSPSEIYRIFKTETISKDEEGMRKALFNTTWGISSKDDFTHQNTYQKRFEILREEMEFLNLYKDEYQIISDPLELNDDLEFMKDFFDTLQDEFTELTEIIILAEKFRDSKVVQNDEFKKTLSKIKTKLDDPGFCARFKKIYKGYEFDINAINSITLKQQLLDLKNWKE